MGFLGSNVTTYQKRDTPYWLNFVYSGQMYKWTNYTSISANSTIYYGFTTPSSGLCHSISRVVTISQARLIVTLLENPTATLSTEKVSNNLYRPSSKVANTKYYTSVTGFSGGTTIDEMYINSYSSYAGKVLQPSGSLVAGLSERIYKPNTKYVVRLQNPDTTYSCNLEVIELFYESGN